MANDIIPLKTSAAPLAIIPADFDAVLEYSRLIESSGLAPSTIKRKEQIAVAIMHGMEVGLTPLAALQSIAVINGRPSLWGDGALALCVASPLCEDIEETIAGTGDAMVATCSIKRKGRAKPIIGTFSMEDAREANLKNKAGPWKEYPKRMLQMRARAFALRDAFPDVLRGIAIAEEIQDMKDVTPADEPPPAPRAAPEPEKAPAAPKTVEGEILPPKPKDDDGAAADRQRQEDEARVAAERQAREAREAEQRRADEERAAEQRRQSDASEADAPQEGDQPDPFEAYLADLVKRMWAAPTREEFVRVWAGRQTDVTDEQRLRMVTERNKLKDHLAELDRKEAEAKAAAKQQEVDNDDFSEPGFREVFRVKLKAAKTAAEAEKISAEVEAHREGGRISEDEYAAYYEDLLVEAIGNLP